MCCTEAMNSLESMPAPFGFILGAIIFILVIAAILMPLYVISMAGELKRIRKLMEKMNWQADLIRKDVDAVKQKWGA